MQFHIKSTHCGRAHLLRNVVATMKVASGGLRRSHLRARNERTLRQKPHSDLYRLFQERAAKKPERTKKISTPSAEFPANCNIKICNFFTIFSMKPEKLKIVNLKKIDGQRKRMRNQISGFPVSDPVFF